MSVLMPGTLYTFGRGMVTELRHCRIDLNTVEWRLEEYYTVASGYPMYGYPP